MVEEHEENPASRRCVGGKGGSVAIAFSDNCGNSLMLHQNLTSGSFLKVNWNVESETNP